MDSYIETHQYNRQQQEIHDHRGGRGENEEHQHQQNSGLLRFRSAPSSLFFEFTQNLNDSDENNSDNNSEYSENYERKPLSLMSNSSQSGYSNPGPMGQLPPQYPKQSVVSTSSSMEKSMAEITHRSTSLGNINGGGLNLNRQSSSPAGFFSQLNTQNGYTIMRGLGSFRVGNGTNGESSPRTGRLGMNHLPRIPEIGNENVKETSPDEVKFRNHEGDAGYDGSAGYSFASWSHSGSDTSHLSENGSLLNRPTILTHHLSLPKTSTEMAAIEKLLHFQDTVPCKVRAKRGCATHPRSIAERVRRNRISERMRKLQELVPNMDKQTNTADMLDLAVDYIKNLQDEFKVLSDDRAKCTCANLQ